MHILNAVLAASMASGVLLGVQAQQSPSRTIKPETSADVVKTPGQPMDARIKAEKVTEVELPPLPQQVILPMPPVFSISTRADQVPMSSEAWEKAHAAMRRGLEFLASQQDRSGAWMPEAKAAPSDQPDKPSPVAVAVTALTMKAFAQAKPEGEAAQDPHVKAALGYIRSVRQPDGSFEAGAMANYVTSSVLMGLASVQDNDLIELVHETRDILKTNQWDQSEGLGIRQDWFGGAGYGNSGRPDMSNTQMMLDALYEAGVSPDEPEMQKALAFASRAQNLKATNKASWTGDDGGFVYTPANGGESMASEAAGEGRRGEKLPTGAPRSLRSYGSMTYAGFKSMLYAGLSPDDVRVRAAFDWLRHHWTFDENPGLGQQGLYYYYHTLARALHVAQQHTITDVNGAPHNWREELVAALLKRQAEDGSWRNQADRWMESDPRLVTTYAVLALQEALKPVTAVALETKPAGTR